MTRSRAAVFIISRSFSQIVWVLEVAWQPALCEAGARSSGFLPLFEAGSPINVPTKIASVAMDDVAAQETPRTGQGLTMPPLELARAANTPYPAIALVPQYRILSHPRGEAPRQA